MRLAGRIAIVTGAANGIGRATALRFAAEGADVAVVDREAAALEAVAAEIEGWGRRALLRSGDCTDATFLADFHDRARGALGPVDVLFNNVGQSARERATDFCLSAEETWRSVVEVSLFVTLRMSRLVAPTMLERGYGRIVNMSSDAALSGDAGLADYAAAKMGVIGFTRSLARELAAAGVTVNAVCPGAIATRAHERLAPAVLERIRGGVPMGWIGAPEDVADAVAFLASDEARYITGQSLLIDGGRWMV